MVRTRTAGNNLYEGQTYFFYRKFAYKTKHPRWILFTMSDVLFSFYHFVSIHFYIHEISRLDSICGERNAFPFKETMHIARVSLDLQEKEDRDTTILCQIFLRQIFYVFLPFVSFFNCTKNMLRLGTVALNHFTWKSKCSPFVDFQFHPALSKLN